MALTFQFAAGVSSSDDEEYEEDVDMKCTEEDMKNSKPVESASSSKLTGTCTRCLKDASFGTCQVPHPAHLRQDCGGEISYGVTRSHFACGACGESYTEVNDTLADQTVPY